MSHHLVRGQDLFLSQAAVIIVLIHGTIHVMEQIGRIHVVEDGAIMLEVFQALEVDGLTPLLTLATI